MDKEMTLRKRGDYRSIKDYIAHYCGSLEELRSWRGKRYEIGLLEETANLIWEAARTGRPIRVIADYDVDGVTSGAGLKRIGEKAGSNDIKVCIPCRYEDGYGANAGQVDRCPEGCLLILVDNGISALEAVREAKRRNMTVVILDHHQAPVDEEGHPVYPEADIVIDPAALPYSADWDKYCASGIVFKLAETMFPDDKEWLDKMSVNAALATIADVVELKEDNYRIVERGLACANAGRAFPGVLALLKATSTETLTTEVANYRINPVLNAPGRMLRRGARLSATLFVSDDQETCEKLVSQMILINEKRKIMCEERMKIAQQIIKGREVQTVNVVYLPDTLTGVVGLIAGRLAEDYGRTFIVVTEGKAPGTLQGSARSAGNTNIKVLLDKTRHLLAHYGGHPGAAGVTLPESNLEALDEALNKEAEAAGYHGADRKDEVLYDFTIKTSRVRGILNALSEFHFGEGMPAPVFCIRDFRPTPSAQGLYRLVGEDSAKLTGQEGVQAFGFHMSKTFDAFKGAQEVTLVGTLSWNEFNGSASPQISITYASPNKKEATVLPLRKALDEIAKGG